MTVKLPIKACQHQVRQYMIIQEHPQVDMQFSKPLYPLGCTVYITSTHNNSDVLPTNETHANFCLLNVRSVKNKEQKIKDLIVDNGSDLTALTETRLRSDQERNGITIGDLCPTGYELTHETQGDKIGGGVGFLYKDTLKTKSQ